ncbi:fructosamine kinase [Lacibacter luteus]|uniref:Fructosamine kinase n=1 Tax=Lacibacter luteus TaxID=2508719 RepID=A0A4Q1CNJ3_9BACT|nr:fructosamine kinase family protein [Lacibacter luteus]RXK62394.1 fructosamine kinase [Lacibacter luteus]
MMNELQQMLDACNLPAMKVQQVTGGDINEAYLLYNHEQRIFLKLNDAMRYPEMFVREAEGLNALRAAEAFHVPEIIATGVTGTKQFLLLQWIERTQPALQYWDVMGKQLAALHLQKQPMAGWKNDNYIGSLQQKNTEQNNWPLFYAEQRILPLATKLCNSGAFTAKQMQHTEQLCNRIAAIFPNEPQSLLHGDLWSGNHFPNEKGLPVLIDPAVYCGHREMDIGMSCLFGGFDKRFYEVYNYWYPLETLWQQRLQLTQLYPLLVHAVLFSGSYIQEAAAILARFGQ